MASSGGMVWWMSAVRNTWINARPMPQKMNGVTHTKVNTMSTQVTMVIAGWVASFPSRAPVSTTPGRRRPRR